LPAARTSAQSLYTTAGVLGDGSAVEGVDGLGDGAVVVGAVGLGGGAVVVGAVGLGAGFEVVALAVGEGAVAGVDAGGLDDGAADDFGPDEGRCAGDVAAGDQGGVGELGVAEGCADGNQLVAGTDGSGTDGRCPDRVTPDVLWTVGASALGSVTELAFWGAWVVAESCAPNGTKNKKPASASTTTAAALTVRTVSRGRLCRGPEVRVCLPRLNCLNVEPFTPRPRGSLPIRALQSKLTVSA
jgi:hypothetical protein